MMRNPCGKTGVPPLSKDAEFVAASHRGVERLNGSKRYYASLPKTFAISVGSNARSVCVRT